MRRLICPLLLGAATSLFAAEEAKPLPAPLVDRVGFPKKSATCAQCHIKAGKEHDFVFRARLPEVKK